MKNKAPNPLPLIEAIRNSTPYMVFIYLNGSCWRFHQILKAVYPDALPYYIHTGREAHVITKLGRKFYDITGEVEGKALYNAAPFNEDIFPGCTAYRENWYCKLWALVKEAERRCLTKQQLKAFTYHD